MMAKDMLLTLEEKVDPRHTALIVVDYQNDFVAQEGVFGRVGLMSSGLGISRPI